MNSASAEAVVHRKGKADANLWEVADEFREASTTLQERSYEPEDIKKAAKALFEWETTEGQAYSPLPETEKPLRRWENSEGKGLFSFADRYIDTLNKELEKTLQESLYESKAAYAAKYRRLLMHNLITEYVFSNKAKVKIKREVKGKGKNKSEEIKAYVPFDGHPGLYQVASSYWLTSAEKLGMEYLQPSSHKYLTKFGATAISAMIPTLTARKKFVDCIANKLSEGSHGDLRDTLRGCYNNYLMETKRSAEKYAAWFKMVTSGVPYTIFTLYLAVVADIAQNMHMLKGGVAEAQLRKIDKEFFEKLNDFLADPERSMKDLKRMSLNALGFDMDVELDAVLKTRNDLDVKDLGKRFHVLRLKDDRMVVINVDLEKLEKVLPFEYYEKLKKSFEEASRVAEQLLSQKADIDGLTKEGKYNVLKSIAGNELYEAKVGNLIEALLQKDIKQFKAHLEQSNSIGKQKHLLVDMLFSSPIAFYGLSPIEIEDRRLLAEYGKKVISRREKRKRSKEKNSNEPKTQAGKFVDGVGAAVQASIKDPRMKPVIYLARKVGAKIMDRFVKKASGKEFIERTNRAKRIHDRIMAPLRGYITKEQAAALSKTISEHELRETKGLLRAYGANPSGKGIK